MERVSISADLVNSPELADILASPPTQGKPTLCCWCDRPAGIAPVIYAGISHPACLDHSIRYNIGSPPPQKDGKGGDA